MYKNIKISGFLFIFLIISSIELFSQKIFSLEECKKFAIINNTKIKNADLEVKIAKEVKNTAFTNYFPSIKTDAFAFKSEKNLLEYSMKGGNLPVYDGNPINLQHPTQFAYMPDSKISMLDYMFIGGINLTQPIYAGSRISNGNKLADLNVEVNKEKFQIAKKEILMRTEEQFWQIYSLKEKIKTLDSYSTLIDALYKDAEIAFKSGLITKNDLLKVNLKQNEIQMNKLKLKNGIDLAMMSFCQFLDIEYTSMINFADTIPELNSPEFYFVNHQNVINERPEYKLLQQSLKAEEIQTNLKLGSYLPEFGIGASLSYLNVLDINKINTIVFGKVSVPLSGWWEESYIHQERKLQEQIAQNNLEENSKLLLLQMQKARNELNESYLQIKFSESSLTQTEENLKEYESNFKSGVINISELLQAESLLQESKEKLIEDRTNYIFKINNYLNVTGR